MSNECIELENIKYQTMLLNGNSKIDSDKKDTFTSIDNILDQEIMVNKSKPWNKLGKSIKVTLLKEYADTYCSENGYDETIQKELVSYLIKSLERKKLTRVKEIVYDSENNIIKSIRKNILFTKV